VSDQDGQKRIPAIKGDRPRGHGKGASFINLKSKDRGVLQESAMKNNGGGANLDGRGSKRSEETKRGKVVVLFFYRWTTGEPFIPLIKEKGVFNGKKKIDGQEVYPSTDYTR